MQKSAIRPTEFKNIGNALNIELTTILRPNILKFLIKNIKTTIQNDITWYDIDCF